MDANAIIIAKQLGKRYLLDQRSTQRTFRETLSQWFHFSSHDAPLTQPFWALRDLNFEIQRGEVIGIIGRNGAGKSTLLKILSRITEPTEGRITLRGRVASLLEVGTGFHPELTGRENIHLNGAILGMTRAEISAKFDEIVSFAEIGEFLDTPVKRYSSGMYVRLAFAVAAHLEPEILIVDEVLAVGDAQFQKKCLGKLHDVADKNGRTVLFVSHNLTAVRQLTTRCLVLEQGRLAHMGTPDSAIAHYLSHRGDEVNVAKLPRINGCCGGARFVALRFENEPAMFDSNAAMSFIAALQWERAVPEARISLTIFSQEGQAVGSGFSAMSVSASSPGASDMKVTIPSTRLAPGRYYCRIALGIKAASAPVNLDAITDVLPFEVIATQPDGRTPTQWETSWGSTQLGELEVVCHP